MIDYLVTKRYCRGVDKHCHFDADPAPHIISGLKIPFNLY